MKPHDTRDFDDCRKIDTYNRSVFEHNNAMLPKVNELLRKLGRNTMNCDAPPKHLPIAKAKYEDLLFNDEFRMLKGIEYLAQGGIYPVKDYEITDAPEMADDDAEKREISRLVEDAGDEYIDISPAVGITHKSNCTCENRWDGVSERCVGEGVRLRWRRLKDHHFLRPRMVPEKY